jgi:ribonuclease T2
MAKGLMVVAVSLVVALGSTLLWAATFDYYVLSLSWAPNFCADAGNAAANPAECALGKHVTFVVHGLWPEAISGKSPESCAKSTPVRSSILNEMLPYMFSASLVQHEWATHGTCSGLTQADYFTEVLAARVAVQLPVEITSLEDAATESPGQIEGQFAAANSSFPAKAFRISCKSGELAEVRVCFDRDVKPRECTSSPGECTGTTVQIRPPR